MNRLSHFLGGILSRSQAPSGSESEYRVEQVDSKSKDTYRFINKNLFSFWKFPVWNFFKKKWQSMQQVSTQSQSTSQGRASTVRTENFTRQSLGRNTVSAESPSVINKGGVGRVSVSVRSGVEAVEEERPNERRSNLSQDNQGRASTVRTENFTRQSLGRDTVSVESPSVTNEGGVGRVSVSVSSEVEAVEGEDPNERRSNLPQDNQDRASTVRTENFTGQSPGRNTVSAESPSVINEGGVGRVLVSSEVEAVEEEGPNERRSNLPQDHQGRASTVRTENFTGQSLGRDTVSAESPSVTNEGGVEKVLVSGLVSSEVEAVEEEGPNERRSNLLHDNQDRASTVRTENFTGQSPGGDTVSAESPSGINDGGVGRVSVSVSSEVEAVEEEGPNERRSNLPQDNQDRASTVRTENFTGQSPGRDTVSVESPSVTNEGGVGRVSVSVRSEVEAVEEEERHSPEQKPASPLDQWAQEHGATVPMESYHKMVAGLPSDVDQLASLKKEKKEELIHQFAESLTPLLDFMDSSSQLVKVDSTKNPEEEGLETLYHLLYHSPNLLEKDKPSLTSSFEETQKASKKAQSAEALLHLWEETRNQQALDWVDKSNSFINQKLLEKELFENIVNDYRVASTTKLAAFKKVIEPLQERNHKILKIKNLFIDIGADDFPSQEEAVSDLPNLLDQLESKDQKNLSTILLTSYQSLTSAEKKVFQERFRGAYQQLSPAKKGLLRNLVQKEPLLLPGLVPQIAAVNN